MGSHAMCLTASRATWRKLAIGILAGGTLALGTLADPPRAQIRLNNPSPSPSMPPPAPAPAPSEQPASSDLIDGRDMEQLADILREQGFQAKVGKSSSGQPRITSAAGGVNFSITTYSCTGESSSCSIDFFTYWRTAAKPLPLEKVNDWNREWRFLKAYNDKDGDLNLVFNVELSGGISKRAFVRNFERWTSMLAKFDKFRQE